MSLILGDVKFDFGEFEDLMPERIRIVACEFLPATSAFGRMERVDFVTVFDWNQLSLMPSVSFLSAAFAFLCGCVIAHSKPAIELRVKIGH